MLEYEHLKQNDFFSILKRNAISGNTGRGLVHNVRSLPRNVDVAVLNKFDTNGVSILSFKKHAFADRALTLMLVYRKQSMNMQEFFHMLQYLLATHSIDIIAGDFSYDLLKVSQFIFLDIFTDHVQMVNKPTHISGSLIDHISRRSISTKL